MSGILERAWVMAIGVLVFMALLRLYGMGMGAFPLGPLRSVLHSFAALIACS